MLYSYSGDERNYALDGAVISCDMMSDEPVSIQFKKDDSSISIKGGGKTIISTYKKPADIGPENDELIYHIIESPVGRKNIRKLHAAFGNSQSDNGIRFVTVVDRSYLREEEEKLALKSDTASNVGKAVGAGIKSAYAAAKENQVSMEPVML